MRRLFFVFLLVFVALFVKGQSLAHVQPVYIKQETKQMELAFSAFHNGDLPKAIDIYRAVYNKYPQNVMLNTALGECYFDMGHFREAMTYWYKAQRVAEDPAPRLFLFLARCHWRVGNTEKAKQLIQSILSDPIAVSEIGRTEAEELLEKIQNAIDLSNKKLTAKMRPLPNPVNSDFSERHPLLAANGKDLYYFSQREQQPGPYQSRKTGAGGKWEAPTALPGKLLSTGTNYLVHLSEDGRKAILLRKEKGKSEGILVEATSKKPGKWSKPKPIFGVKETPMIREACFTQDGQTLFYVAEKAKVFGAGDIYLCKRTGKKSWSPPQNLGPLINTPEDEGGMWTNAKGTELFFWSKGHKGMGGYDIFKTTQLNGKWAKPFNLGFPINSVGEDVDFSLSPDGRSALMASTGTSGTPNFNIFQVELGEFSSRNKGKNVYVQAVISGKVSDAKTGQAVSNAKLSVVERSSQKKAGRTATTANGSYKLNLVGNRTYLITIKAEGYAPLTTEINVVLNAVDRTILKRDFSLEPR